MDFFSVLHACLIAGGSAERASPMRIKNRNPISRDGYCATSGNSSWDDLVLCSGLRTAVHPAR